MPPAELKRGSTPGRHPHGPYPSAPQMDFGAKVLKVMTWGLKCCNGALFLPRNRSLLNQIKECIISWRAREWQAKFETKKWQKSNEIVAKIGKKWHTWSSSPTCSGGRRGAHRTPDILSGNLIGATGPCYLWPPTLLTIWHKEKSFLEFAVWLSPLNTLGLFLLGSPLCCSCWFITLKCKFSQSNSFDCTFNNINLCESLPSSLIKYQLLKKVWKVNICRNLCSLLLLVSHYLPIT